MSKAISARYLFDTMRDRLKLSWVAGHEGGDQILEQEVVKQGGASLLGHLNLIHPNQIQVIGEVEMAYLTRLRKNSLQDTYEELFHSKPAIILMADGEKPPKYFLQLADRYQVPLFNTPMPGYEVISILRYYLTNRMAESTTVHGVYMEVMGIGVLLAGESSVGKSELALDLINRGHRLIADDSPVFARIAPDILHGSCPEVLQDFLEVRGLGVLNIRSMYGDNAIKNGKYLRLIVHLKHYREVRMSENDRLQGRVRYREILGLQIPEVTIPVAPGRNLAVLVEAAVRIHLLREGGYNAGSDLADRQQTIMNRT
ncbi:MAG: HPr(Ser) kinase/phosphatase [Gammaproteobacteria bacterium]|jgi:HPr kinase/phosphorylase